MRAAVLALAALSTAIAAAPAQAEPVVLKPSSPWNVDFGENKCRLARFFGEEGNKHVLIFEQYWPEASLGMTAAGTSFKPFRSTRPTELSFFSAEAPTETQPFTGALGDYGEALVFSRVQVSKASEAGEGAIRPPVSWRQLDTAIAQEVSTVTLKQRANEVQLVTGPLDEAFQVLNLCTKDLVASWGFDADQQLSASRLTQWINPVEISRKIQETYPSQALKRGEQAIMRMRVIVNEKGVMEDCVIIQATVTEKLDSPACQSMKRAKFEPALDAEGKPMRSYFATSITYRIN